MKILILGSSGQLGSDIKKIFNSVNISRKKNEIEYTNKKKIKSLIEKFLPDLIINCVAYTNVNKAINQKKICKYLNFYFPRFLSGLCYKKNITLIHFSTDYVFDGKSTKKYTETSKPNPLNFYGLTKLNGDLSIINSGCRYFIFRISWLYNPKFKNNFVYKVRDKIQKKVSFSLPTNEIGSPISSSLLSYYIKKFISMKNFNKFSSGIFNLTWRDYVSRYGLGVEISKILKIKSEISPIKKIFINNRATVKRPSNSKLNIKKIEKILKLNIFTWKKDLRLNLLKK